MSFQNSLAYKESLFDQFARVGKAFANGRRLEIVDILSQGQRTVEELAREANLPVANASQHLQVLRRARLVETRREGTYVYYRLASERVIRLWQALRELGEERLAEIDEIVRAYHARRETLEPVQMEELLQRMFDDGVTVLDVRPEQEYAAGHIEGARSIPLNELESRLGEIPPNSEVIAYCRGPYCILADEAVERLREYGVAARRLAGGFPDWRLAGFPVEQELVEK